MLLTIIIFLIVLGLLVFVHELGHFVMAKRAGMAVEEFGFGFPPRLFGIKKGETIYSINWIPLGGFVKIVGEDGETGNDPRGFGGKSFGRRLAVLAAGVIMNLIFAWVLISVGLGLGLPTVVNDGDVIPKNAIVKNSMVTVVEVLPDAPAAQAGIKIGDRITQINGVEVSTMEQIQQSTTQNLGKPTQYTIVRGNDVLEKEVTPRIDYPEGQGPTGIALSSVARVSYPWYWAPIKGLETTWNLTWATLSAFGTIIVNLVSGEPAGVDLTGPVGIAQLTGDVAALGFVYLLQFTAILSINLAIINAVPFPALDGGRILFLIIEKVRGKKMNANAEQWANAIGFSLLLLLMLIITVRDVSKIDLVGRIKNIF
jgi:regulator of sigma E protease